MNRRQFLATAAVAAGAGNAAPKLALDGGTPVRQKPLQAGFWGTQYYDDKERAQLT